MANNTRGKMPVSERAKQFIPFAAVRGLNEGMVRKEKELALVSWIELSEESATELSKKLSLIEKGLVVSVIYFDKGEYVTLTGIVGFVDAVFHVLEIGNTKILFKNIHDINIEDLYARGEIK